MDRPSSNPPRPWRWIPSLYFAEGLPYVVVTTLAIVFYKNLQVSNTDIAFYTSWLGFPWVLKPLWSPLVEMFGRKRRWIVTLQFLMGAACAAVAWVIPAPQFIQATLAVFCLIAFASATHDIAADGYYMLAQSPSEQAAFVGVRSTFYRLAMIAGQGGLVWLAGRLTRYFGQPAPAWVVVFAILSALLLAAGAVHAWVLPRPEADLPTRRAANIVREFWDTVVSFFTKPLMGRALLFLLVYRLAEAQALKLVQPFLLDPRSAGGLGLDTEQVGVAYGIVGVVSLLGGGITGGLLIARHGLKRMLWPMILMMHVPIAIFLALAMAQPTSFPVICAGLAVEQFGYGFGFTAYMVFMMLIADGERKTAHYAFCTGFMALGLMLPGMAAGWIEDHVGYQKFFLWVLACTLPSFLAVSWLRIDPAFGRKA
jgi:PAT family beta-lactamase induction signal transducer AmpG